MLPSSPRQTRYIEDLVTSARTQKFFVALCNVLGCTVPLRAETAITERQDATTQRIYADCNAETFECPESLSVKRMLTSSSSRLGNASSRHVEGRTAKAVLDFARNTIETECGALPESLIFTSGATESNHLAIVAGMNATGGKSRVVTTKFEHASVSRVVSEYDPLYVRLGRAGDVDAASLVDLCSEPDVGMATLILAHNEIGIVQSISGIRDAIQFARRNRETHLRSASPAQNLPMLHYDATQIFGKARFRMAESEADLVSWSGHKFCGPGGIGGLFSSIRTNLKPYPICCCASGEPGGQERGLRAGTENVCGAACAAAALIAEDDRGEKSWAVTQKLADSIVRRVWTTNKNPDALTIEVNAAPSIPKPQTCDRLCNTIHLSFVGREDVSGVDVANWLDAQRGIAVSTGSACSKSHPSLALEAIGLDAAHIRGAIRISLCPGTVTEKDAERLAAALLDATTMVVAQRK